MSELMDFQLPSLSLYLVQGTFQEMYLLEKSLSLHSYSNRALTSL